jgi:hypothetical protein
MFGRPLGWIPHALGMGVVTALACALYWPFLSNPLVFDDWTFFSGIGFSYYATHPIGLQLRTPPYFTLAVTEILIGGVEAHRIVSLVLHLVCAFCLFKLIYDLMRAPAAETRGAEAERQGRALVYALIGAAAFAIHPGRVRGGLPRSAHDCHGNAFLAVVDRALRPRTRAQSSC